MPNEGSAYGQMRRQEVLVRRARLRALLNRHSGPDGYSTYDQIATALNVSLPTIRKDCAEMGAVKVADTIDGRTFQWWIIPAYNPNLPDYREHMDETLMLNEISLKIRSHVVDMFLFGNEIIIKTERSAGPLMADWFSLLPWPEILHVSEERHACVIKCIDSEVAEWVRTRITGEKEEE